VKGERTKRGGERGKSSERRADEERGRENRRMRGKEKDC
jgi:hypothetical protein